MIPPSVRCKVLTNKFQCLIDNSDYFREADDTVRLFLLKSLQVHFLSPEVTIVEQFDEVNQDIFVNGEGLISVFKRIVSRGKEL